MSEYSLADYTPIGDPDSTHEPTKKDARRQQDADNIRRSVERMHFHRYTSGEEEGTWFSHTHDDDCPAHDHPKERAYPARADGGFDRTSSPAQPDLPAQHVAAMAKRFVALTSNWTPTPDHMLMRWRLRLFCGHVVERTAHLSYKTAEAAFGSLRACPECGLDPSTVVAARPLGLAGLPPTPTPAPQPRSRATLEKRLAKAEAEVAALRRELDKAEASGS